MENHVYKTITITGSSNVSIEEAVQSAIKRAAKTIRHLRWFEVAETRGTVDESAVGQWQVTVKIGFLMEDAE